MVRQREEQDKRCPSGFTKRPCQFYPTAHRRSEEGGRCCRNNKATLRSFQGTTYGEVERSLPGANIFKETAKLEAEAFELEQKTALAAEAKSVLDSWVRYESQMKQRQQKELAQNIISKITKELENQKTLQQILNQSVADVESE